MSGKILSIDLGTKHIGLAVSDPEQKIAFPLEVVAARPLDLILETIERLIKEEGIKMIVLGRPASLAGKKLPMSKLVNKFSYRLREKFKLKVVLVDERLSTKMAGGKQGAGRPDARAAAIFLQNYLDANQRQVE